MVTDVRGVEARLAAVGSRRLVVVHRFMTGALGQVGVVEVQAAHLLVMVGCSMHVCASGHEAERHIGGTRAESEKPTHLAESNRLDMLAL